MRCKRVWGGRWEIPGIFLPLCLGAELKGRDAELPGRATAESLLHPPAEKDLAELKAYLFPLLVGFQKKKKKV